MAKMIIDAPNTCKECMGRGLACGMIHKDYDTARKADCPLNILPEGSIFTKDEVLSIIKEIYIHKADYENCLKADFMALCANESSSEKPNKSENPISSTTKNDLGVEKIIDEVEKEFEKVDIPIMDKLTIFAKVQNALYKCAVSNNSVGMIRPKGHWEHGKELSKEYRGRILVDVTYADWHCSNCNYVIKQSNKPKWNYCPNCGADMRAGEEND